jgi:hypothetical protein
LLADASSRPMTGQRRPRVYARSMPVSPLRKRILLASPAALRMRDQEILDPVPGAKLFFQAPGHFPAPGHGWDGLSGFRYLGRTFGRPLGPFFLDLIGLAGEVSCFVRASSLFFPLPILLKGSRRSGRGGANAHPWTSPPDRLAFITHRVADFFRSTVK